MFVVLSQVRFFSQGQGLQCNQSSPWQGQQYQGDSEIEIQLCSDRVAVIACRAIDKRLGSTNRETGSTL